MRSRHFAAHGLVAVLGGLPHALGASLSDTPGVDDFVRRSGVSATVMGDYVYFDGGEMSQLLDGKHQKDVIGYDFSPVNSTISIDMSKSWTNSEVVLRTIERPWAPKANQAIWTDTEEGAFYVWGGRWPRGQNMTSNEYWKFTADGEGSGVWSRETPANPALFNDLEQYEYGAFVNTADTGFSIGGHASAWTKRYRASNQVIPGMVAYNMKTKIWHNGTTAFSPFDTIAAAVAHYVPNFGPNGLAMVLGGLMMPLGEESNWETAVPYDLQNLTFFDPETKEKYWQTTSGAIPPTPRSQFCLAGFRDTDSGGYDLLLFGGYNHRDKFAYDDAYILSLPGFVWTKVPQTTAGARRYHSCVSVGKRQVLVIGGTRDGWGDPDPAPQGLLLFDMTNWEWKDSYDARAPAYKRAAEIQDWYRENSLDTVDWSSQKVQQLFSTETPTADSGEDNDAPAGKESSSSSTPVGAIVGGVVGGVAGIALIAVAIWLFVRRRRKASRSGQWDDEDAPHDEQQQHAVGATKPGSPSELSAATPVNKPENLPAELNTQLGYAELNTQPIHAELSGSAAYEYMPPPPQYPVGPVELDSSAARY